MFQRPADAKSAGRLLTGSRDAGSEPCDHLFDPELLFLELSEEGRIWSGPAGLRGDSGVQPGMLGDQCGRMGFLHTDFPFVSDLGQRNKSRFACLVASKK